MFKRKIKHNLPTYQWHVHPKMDIKLDKSVSKSIIKYNQRQPHSTVNPKCGDQVLVKQHKNNKLTQQYNPYQYTLPKFKFSIKNFFTKCDQIRGKLKVWSHLLKKYP